MISSPVQNYFYAEQDAEFYDATVGLTTEAYALLHQQIARLLETWRTQCNRSRDPLILDIGAGTGAEALSILRAVPDARLICVDASDAMLTQLHRKVSEEFGDPTARGRCKSIVADAYEPNWLSGLSAREGWGHFDLIVSVYLYHHLRGDQKAPLYQQFFDHLVSGGVFLHGDLFSYEDGCLAVTAQNIEDDWVTKSFSNPAVYRPLGISDDDAKQLLSKWLEHYRNDNKPIPIYSNSLIDGETERALLSAAGFQRIEVPFRLFQNGVIWACK